MTSGRDGTLSRIDVAEGRLDGAPLELEKGLSGVTVGAGSVWVSSPRAREVLRIDGDTGRIEDRAEVHMRPGAIVFGGERVWVADLDGGGVSAIDVRSGRILKRGIAPRQAPLRLAVGAGGVWVSSAATGTVSRIGLKTMLTGTPVLAGRTPSGITVGGGVVWVADTRSDAVRRVDSATGALLGAPIEVGRQPGGIASGTDVVWVANRADGSVSRIDISSGETVGDPIAVGRHPGAVAVGRTAVWIADNGDGSVTRIEP